MLVFLAPVWCSTLRRAGTWGTVWGMPQLTEANISYTYWAAKRFWLRTGRSVELEELQSAAIVGMLVAEGRFDESHGVKFVTYARWYVDDEMFKVYNATHPLLHDLTVDPADVEDPVARRLLEAGGAGAEVCEELGITRSRAEWILRKVKRKLGHRARLSSMTPWDEHEHAPGNAYTMPVVDAEIRAKHVRAAVDKLPPKQREVILGMYYGHVTGADIAKRMGVTRQAVNLHKHRAFKALAKSLRGR